MPYRIEGAPHPIAADFERTLNWQRGPSGWTGLVYDRYGRLEAIGGGDNAEDVFLGLYEDLLPPSE